MAFDLRFVHVHEVAALQLQPCQHSTDPRSCRMRGPPCFKILIVKVSRGRPVAAAADPWSHCADKQVRCGQGAACTFDDLRLCRCAVVMRWRAVQERSGPPLEQVSVYRQGCLAWCSAATQASHHGVARHLRRGGAHLLCLPAGKGVAS